MIFCVTKLTHAEISDYFCVAFLTKYYITDEKKARKTNYRENIFKRLQISSVIKLTHAEMFCVRKLTHFEISECFCVALLTTYYVK